MRRCVGPCGLELPATLDYFYRSGTLASGAPKLAARCKPCLLEYRRELGYRPRKRAAYFRAYRKRMSAEQRAVGNARNRRRRRGTDVHAREVRSQATVPNAPLREALQASDITAGEIARRIGVEWSSVARALGLHAAEGKMRTHLSVDFARKILRAMGLDPVDVGL